LDQRHTARSVPLDAPRKAIPMKEESSRSAYFGQLLGNTGLPLLDLMASNEYRPTDRASFGMLTNFHSADS
jgi:hypothetical protein